jgi:spore maturation protein CgeB
MRRAGYSPSVRLFEAAACGTPIISDDWPGLAELLVPGEEILVARTADDVTTLLKDLSDAQAQRIADAARARICTGHSSGQRALEFQSYLDAAGFVTARGRAAERGAAADALRMAASH